jgi:hypothetical protein
VDSGRTKAIVNSDFVVAHKLLWVRPALIKRPSRRLKKGIPGYRPIEWLTSANPIACRSLCEMRYRISLNYSEKRRCQIDKKGSLPRDPGRQARPPLPRDPGRRCQNRVA